MAWDVSWNDLTPDKSTPENNMFQGETSRAYQGNGEAIEYSDSAGSQRDRQPIQWQDIEIPEHLCAPQVKKDDVPVPERSKTVSFDGFVRILKLERTELTSHTQKWRFSFRPTSCHSHDTKTSKPSTTTMVPRVTWLRMSYKRKRKRKKNLPQKLDR